MPLHNDNLSLFTTTLAAWNISFSDEQLAHYANYIHELQQWNTRVNLTAITDEQQIVTRHLLDSLRCSLSWGKTVPHSLIDVGTGAGFPGIPLLIAYPHLSLTLVESVGKKVAFLRHIVTTLHLEHVTILALRAEEVGNVKSVYRGVYDVAVARAVADLRVLAEYCLPLVHVGGYVLAPKGAACDDEIAAAHGAIRRLGGTISAVEPVTIPTLTTQRTMVVIQKVAATPARYPRGVGIPARCPLS